MNFDPIFSRVWSLTPNCPSPILPITGSLDEIRSALRTADAVVVHAPPGAGKTTIVPPALLDEKWLGGGRIVMLEPRRLAARAAAQRMADLRSEPVGRTIGYRTRIDTKVSADTRIEVVTEGILTRILQNDPTLDGYGLVIFDEFHERSLQGDTGLALTLHTRQLVRADLRVAVMSATLDGTVVAQLLNDAPVVTSHGREFHVETRFRPPPRGARSILVFDPHLVASAIRTALRDTSEGDVLVFLPGAPEINRVQQVLVEERLQGVGVIPLHGSLQPAQQDRALAPAASGLRKVILATSIAETSLTIDGVRVVIDSGLARRSRFSPRTGMSRLETLRVSRAAADQRRGRAGRTAPGICYRLWSEEEDAALQPFAPPEIMEGDLAPLALELAVAGVSAAELSWFDPPPQAAYSQATELLQQLDAIDDHGRVTSHGQAMAKFGMHPRLAHMLLRATAQGLGPLACDVAAIVAERDPLRGLRDTVGTDLRARVDAMKKPREFPGADVNALKRAIEQSRKWFARLPPTADAATDEPTAVGQALALAYPDRLARRRPGQSPRYLLRNGTGAILPEGDALGQSPFIVIAESDGKVPESRVWLSAPLDTEDVEIAFGDQIVDEQHVEWSEDGIRASRSRRLGAIELARAPLRDPDPDLVASAVSEAIRRQGLDVLHWTVSAQKFRQRLAFLHAHDPGWPDVSDATLTNVLLGQLHEALGRVRTGRELRNIDVTAALTGLLDWGQRKRLDDLAPTHFEAPTGSRLPIDYADPRSPAVSVRLQEMFGTRTTPTILTGRVALTLHLLSPAHRPVQVTRDLAGFWRTSYYDVRKDLRARYPKHSWPDDPLAAAPTRRARPRE